jgi:hypothetical protein
MDSDDIPAIRQSLNSAQSAQSGHPQKRLAMPILPPMLDLPVNPVVPTSTEKTVQENGLVEQAKF